MQLVETDAVAGGDARILATKGTLCKGASDVAACQRASASLDLGGGWPATGGDATRKNAAALRHSLVFTRGDTVSIVKTIEDLRAMVAPVDSIEKAALLVTESLDRQIDCGKNHADKVDGGGYEFFMSRTTRFVNPGCQEHEEYVDRVDGAGTASMLKSEPVRLGGGC